LSNAIESARVIPVTAASPPDLRETLANYIKLLQGQGTRDVLLSPAARRGLNFLGTSKRQSAVAAVSDRRPESITVAPVKAPLSKGLPTAAPVEGMTKIEKLKHLNERVSVCQKCPHLAAARSQTVFGVGNPDATLMFVGEAPGVDEDRQGEPFVGAAGQLLTKMILAMGLTRDQVYITNILKCRPDMPKGSSGNRKPTPVEMNTCLPYILAQFEIIQPRVMVALGGTALEGLFGAGEKISRVRGTFLDFQGIPVMPTFHPSFLLRNQSNTEKRKVWEDLLKVMEHLALPVSDKQRGYFLAANR
jgi:uracil-DNA glycosylase